MATAAYDAVAASRPRIRRDVLFTETPDGVLFHTADGGFQLTAKSAYRFASLIVPHLDGENSVAEISAGFGDRQRAMLGELVRTLYARDFARDVPVPDGEPGEEGFPTPQAARRFATQIAYVDHYADEPGRRFQRFREARVAVVGEDETARWCALGLIRNGGATIGLLPGVARADIDAEAAEAAADGCPVELITLGGGGAADGALSWGELDPFDIVLVTGGPRAAQRLLPLLREGIPEGTVVVPAWSFGELAVMGPLMARERPGCLCCALLRLGSGGGSRAGSAAVAADVWSSLALPGAGPVGGEPGRPQAAMIGNMLGYEVFRFTTGALSAETDGQLVIQDMASLDVTSEPLLPHPRCTLCTPAARGGERAAVGTGDGETAAVPAEFAGPAALAGPAGSVADEAAVDLSSAGTAEVPMPTAATARDADALVEELNRRSTLVRSHVGVFTRFADEELTQLPLKAGIVELGLGHGSFRRIAAFDVHHVAGARMRALDAAAGVYAEHVVPTRALPTGAAPSGARESLRVVGPGDLVTSSGTGAAAGDVTAWTVATSLVTKERVLVPAAAVRPFGAGNADRFVEPTSAGTGAGPSLADAAARGLLSALGYDALMRSVRGTAAAPAETPDPGADGPGAEAEPELTFLVRSMEQLGLDWELLDLGESARSRVHVLLARSGTRWAVGSETSRRAAAVAALRDLLGQIQLGREDEDHVDTGDPLLRDFAPGTLTVADAAPAPDGAQDPGTWTDVLERLRAAGRDALLVPTGSADLASAGITTVRVLLTEGTGHDAH